MIWLLSLLAINTKTTLSRRELPEESMKIPIRYCETEEPCAEIVKNLFKVGLRGSELLNACIAEHTNLYKKFPDMHDYVTYILDTETGQIEMEKNQGARKLNAEDLDGWQKKELVELFTELIEFEERSS
jgi:hypothetical protein